MTIIKRELLAKIHQDEVKKSKKRLSWPEILLYRTKCISRIKRKITKKEEKSRNEAWSAIEEVFERENRELDFFFFCLKKT